MTDEQPQIASQPETVACPACRFQLQSWWNFCPNCGNAMRHHRAATTPAVKRPSWYYHPLWISLLAFTVLGPFALPLVWKSPQMRPWAKWTLTLTILLFTALLFLVTGWTVSLLLDRLEEMNSYL